MGTRHVRRAVAGPRAGSFALAGLAAALALAVAVAVVGVGRAAADGSTTARGAQRAGAAAFMKRLVVALGRQQYSRAWEDLHPRHQRVAPLSEYIVCERLSPIPGRIKSVEVLRVVDEPFRVAGMQQAVASKAVTFAVFLRVPREPHPVRVVHTGHVVRAGGRWTFVLPPERFELYRRDGCGPPPTA